MVRSNVAVQPATAASYCVTAGDSRPNKILREVGFQDHWNLATVAALVSLVLLWAWKFHSTWAAWGNLSIDSGHEMYIPALLAEGKMLYRDVWFNFGPAAPYFNGFLFRLFGAKLIVLYWAGSLSALASALFLYLAGMQLSSWKVGWTAGAVLLLEAFQPSLFCFPLPYSFSAVYGCVTACLFLYLIIKISASEHWIWMSTAGVVASIALLLKPEFGIACYLTLILLISLRGFRKPESVARDLLTILPGILVCAAVIRWMISIRGVGFIIYENIQSWPTSFFMKTYGSFWLQQNGFSLNAASLSDALIRSLFPGGVLLELYCMFKWKHSDVRSILMRLTLFAGLAAYYVFMGLTPQTALSAVVFPRDMVLYVLIATVTFCIIGWREILAESGKAAIPLVLIFSGVLAFRILLKMTPADYPIYYNGPVALCFLLLALILIRGTIRTRKFVLVAELLVCLAVLLNVGTYANAKESAAKEFVPLTTTRGTVRVPQHLAETYQSAITFMKETAASAEYVLSIPEDTSLYFLSETHCPTRVFLLIPGSLAPGKMTDEFIQQIEQKPVRYLLWSNRMFWEYGVPIFGRDFDSNVADYLKAHYHRVRPLPPQTISLKDWNAQIWERNE
jgi:hypothetical protein